MVHIAIHTMSITIRTFTDMHTMHIFSMHRRAYHFGLETDVYYNSKSQKLINFKWSSLLRRFSFRSGTLGD